MGDLVLLPKRVLLMITKEAIIGTVATIGGMFTAASLTAIVAQLLQS